MSKKPVSPKLEKFLEERRETELQHLKYLRESKRAFLEKERAERDRAAATGYDFSTGTYIHSTSAATYDLPAPATHAADALRYAATIPAPTTDATIKYLTLEEAMRPYESVGGYSYVHSTASPRYVVGVPSVVLERIVRIPALSDGTYPEVGMRVMHGSITFEIERIEIDTSTWEAVAVGRAESEDGMWSTSRVLVRAPVNDLQPAKAPTPEPEDEDVT